MSEPLLVVDSRHDDYQHEAWERSGSREGGLGFLAMTWQFPTPIDEAAVQYAFVKTLQNTIKMKNILVTGGNAGIGLALCRQLLVDHGCFVFMGARSTERASLSVKSITKDFPNLAENVEVLEMDVSDDASVAAAASAFKATGKTLDAIVNNAGVGLNR